jgi:hypothetical protein
MNPNTFHLAEIIHEDRLAKAAEARKWAANSVSSPLRDRLRLALSKRLMHWSERLSTPTVQVKVRV